MNDGKVAQSDQDLRSWLSSYLEAIRQSLVLSHDVL